MAEHYVPGRLLRRRVLETCCFCPVDVRYLPIDVPHHRPKDMLACVWFKAFAKFLVALRRADRQHVLYNHLASDESLSCQNEGQFKQSKNEEIGGAIDRGRPKGNLRR